MTIQSLLEDPAENLDTFEIAGRTVKLHEFTVAEYSTLRSLTSVLGEIFARTENPRLRIAYMLTDALKESCLLIACGTDMEAEAILSLTPDDFMAALAQVTKKNLGFFLDAALDKIENVAAN